MVKCESDKIKNLKGDNNSLAVISIVLAALIVFLLVISFSCSNSERQLGKAICEEETGGTYRGYSNGKIYCDIRAKPDYDGLVIVER